MEGETRRDRGEKDAGERKKMKVRNTWRDAGKRQGEI